MFIRLFIMLIPAVLLALVVWFFTEQLFWAGITFLVVAALSILKKIWQRHLTPNLLYYLLKGACTLLRKRVSFENRLDWWKLKADFRNFKVALNPLQKTKIDCLFLFLSCIDCFNFKCFSLLIHEKNEFFH